MKNIFKYISPLIFLIIFLIFLLEINYLTHENQIINANFIGLIFSIIGLFYSAIVWNKFMNNYNNVIKNSMLDGMTGLFTHKFFMDRLDSELGRAKRHKEKLTLLFLDLDKFKRINDTYGHLFGDLVIKETAKLIKNILICSCFLSPIDIANIASAYGLAIPALLIKIAPHSSCGRLKYDFPFHLI